MKRQWLPFLLAFALPTLGILWWWGLFSTASVEVAERGPYRYAYLEAEGPYSKLVTKRGEVEGALRQHGAELHRSITIIFDDPRTTSDDKLRARTGFLIAPDFNPPAPLQVDTVPTRRVLTASIKAHPVFAYGKVYAALLDYTQRHHMRLRMPTVELYDASVLTVEMPLETAP